MLNFSLTPYQFVSAYHNKLGATRPCLPLSCEVHDSPRWTAATKPKPRPGKVIGVCGFIDRVIRTDTGAIDKLVITVDQVIYLADGSPPQQATIKLENTLGEFMHSTICIWHALKTYRLPHPFKAQIQVWGIWDAT